MGTELNVTLGETYVDCITKFQGAAIGVTSYITGCDQILLSRPAKEIGEEGKSMWFDVGRLEHVPGHRVSLPAHARHDTGADISAPLK